MSLISGYIRTVFANILAQRQSRTIREILFRSILNKDIIYFDEHKTGELSLYLTENVNKIQDGIGEKLGSAIEMISTCISGIIIGEIDFNYYKFNRLIDYWYRFYPRMEISICYTIIITNYLYCNSDFVQSEISMNFIVKSNICTSR
jgi:ABC-type multidrug transport system fused ATPase/permease subunit